MLFLAHVTMCTSSYRKRMSKMYYYRKTREEKSSFQVVSSVTHTKTKLRSVQIYEFGSRYVQQTQSQRLIPLLKSCLRPSSAVTIGDVNKVMVIAITCLCGAIGTKVHTRHEKKCNLLVKFKYACFKMRGFCFDNFYIKKCNLVYYSQSRCFSQCFAQLSCVRPAQLFIHKNS